MTPVEEIHRAAQLMREPDDISAHISAWRRKKVQLAVADWLDNAAVLMEQQYDAGQHPLAVARAYLGGAM